MLTKIKYFLLLKKKELCQQNGENEKLVEFKMNHIIDCYINNRITPKLRIDIAPELAKEIIEKKDYQSPYLFLKPYVRFFFIFVAEQISKSLDSFFMILKKLIIFDYLMPYWLEFDKMRSKTDLDLFDEFSGFKKTDLARNSASKTDSAKSADDLFDNEKEVAKWRQNQYIRALKAKLVS